MVLTQIRFPLLGFAVALAATAFAQDSLFYTNGNVIVGQVEEIGVNVIKYRTTSDGQSVLIAVDKQDLSKVKLRAGQTLNFTSGSTVQRHSAAFAGRKNAFTFDVIAPALNHITIGYERVMGKRTSLVLKAGYIGLWQDRTRLEPSALYDCQGVLVAAGVKFILPRSADRNTPPGDLHPLAGWYLRPELVFSTWSRVSFYNFQSSPYQPPYAVRTVYHHRSAAVLLSVGRELFLGEHFTFDISGGLGYGKEWSGGESNISGEPYSIPDDYAYTHLFINGISPFVLSGAMRFGYVF